MQLLMRRPEIEGFISVAPPANLYDFSFLAPCPSSGLIIHGDKDAVVPHKDVTGLVDKLKTQKGIIIEQKVIAGRQPLLRRQGRAADAVGQRLSRQAAEGGPPGLSPAPRRLLDNRQAGRLHRLAIGPARPSMNSSGVVSATSARHLRQALEGRDGENFDVPAVGVVHQLRRISEIHLDLARRETSHRHAG